MKVEGARKTFERNKKKRLCSIASKTGNSRLPHHQLQSLREHAPRLKLHLPPGPVQPWSLFLQVSDPSQVTAGQQNVCMEKQITDPFLKVCKRLLSKVFKVSVQIWRDY